MMAVNWRMTPGEYSTEIFFSGSSEGGCSHQGTRQPSPLHGERREVHPKGRSSAAKWARWKNIRYRQAGSKNTYDRYPRFIEEDKRKGKKRCRKYISGSKQKGEDNDYPIKIFPFPRKVPAAYQTAFTCHDHQERNFECQPEGKTGPGYKGEIAAEFRQRDEVFRRKMQKKRKSLGQHHKKRKKHP